VAQLKLTSMTNRVQEWVRLIIIIIIIIIEATRPDALCAAG